MTTTLMQAHGCLTFGDAMPASNMGFQYLSFKNRQSNGEGADDDLDEVLKSETPSPSSRQQPHEEHVFRLVLGSSCFLDMSNHCFGILQSFVIFWAVPWYLGRFACSMVPSRIIFVSFLPVAVCAMVGDVQAMIH